MSAMSVEDIQAYIRQQFRERGNVDVMDISVRPYPDETNYIVLVDEADVPAAVIIGNGLDEAISTPGSRAFVIVRRAPRSLIEQKLPPLSTASKTRV